MVIAGGLCSLTLYHFRFSTMCEVQNSVTTEAPVDIEQSWFSIVKNVTLIVTHAGIIIGILKYYSSAQSKLCLLFSVFCFTTCTLCILFHYIKWTTESPDWSLSLPFNLWSEWNIWASPVYIIRLQNRWQFALKITISLAHCRGLILHDTKWDKREVTYYVFPFKDLKKINFTYLFF